MPLPVTVPAHGSWYADVEGLLGRFLDLSYAFRFGSPAVATVVATFEDGGTDPQAFHFPVGRPTTRHHPSVLSLERSGDVLMMTSERLLDTVELSCDSRPSDNCFTLEPGVTRTIHGVRGSLSVSALNLVPED